MILVLKTIAKKVYFYLIFKRIQNILLSDLVN